MAVVFEQFVDARDVGMMEGRQQLRLAFEPRDPIGVGGHFTWQRLDRDLALQLAVARAVHLAHTA